MPELYSKICRTILCVPQCPFERTVEHRWPCIFGVVEWLIEDDTVSMETIYAIRVLNGYDDTVFGGIQMATRGRPREFVSVIVDGKTIRRKLVDGKYIRLRGSLWEIWQDKGIGIPVKRTREVSYTSQ